MILTNFPIRLMTEDFQYRTKRMQLLFEQLKWMLEKQQLGLSLDELTKRMQLGSWEVRNLFGEYLGKDPLRFVQDAFSPSLANVSRGIQVSFLDSPELKPERNSIPVEMKPIDSPEEIRFTTFNHFLGKVFIASTEQGICQLTFQDIENGFARLKKTFPKALLTSEKTELHQMAFEAICAYFTSSRKDLPLIPLAVKGTDFQLNVWNELTQLQPGELSTYGEIASKLGDKNALRAVGSAIGSNPVALLIPCHRIIQRNDKVGNFRWGTLRKQMILAIEK